MRLLLVEDEAELARWLAKALAGSGFSVDSACSAGQAETLLRTQAYALILLDLNLGSQDGLDLLRRLRGRGTRTPVLVVTARADVEARVEGLNCGADDYLAKPFALAELEARIKALLRRSEGNPAPQIQCGGLVFDTVSRSFSCGGVALALTPRERAVLEALIARVGHAVGKEKLFEQVFSIDDESDPAAIEIYVHRLRRKLTGTGVTIATLRGLGYLLQAQTE